MFTWDLFTGSGTGLLLSADARLSHPDYTNDHIWEIKRINMEPAALCLQTTFGLRASWLRLYPTFTRKGVTLSDPLQFSQPPRVKAYYPNYIVIRFLPFTGVEVLAEYWVPESNVITGRFRVANQSILTESFRFEWAGTFSPVGEGEGMAAVQMDANQVLRCRGGGLAPVCFLSGNPMGNNSPTSSLFLDVELFPGNYRQFNWAVASLPRTEESLALARATVSKSWDAEISRVELQNASQLIEVLTGDVDIDTTISMGQKAAYSLFFPGQDKMPNPSPVLTRLPDQGFSFRGDGSDAPHTWSGVTPLHVYHLTNLLLPGGADLCKGLVENYLNIQDANGFIDLKPGVAGQRSRRLAQPLLCTITLRVLQYLEEDEDWLKKVYPSLLKYIRLWFEPSYDRDGDGFPEWDHLLQAGLEESPIVDPWHSGSQGVSSFSLESPSLGAMLLKECLALGKIARQLEDLEATAWLDEKSALLRAGLSDCWDAGANEYRYRDYATHHSGPGKELLVFRGAGKFSVRRSTGGEQRLLLKTKIKGGSASKLSVKIFGENNGSLISEQPTMRELAWGHGQVFYTTRQLFTKVNRLEVLGLDEEEQGVLSTIDYTAQDISTFLPLWAGAVDADRAKSLVEKNLVPRWFCEYGIPNARLDPGEGEDVYGRVDLLWNTLICEGLVANGFREQAADLVMRLLKAATKCLKMNGTFCDYFHACSGIAGGERNSLRGFFPVGLFLQVLGITRISMNSVILQDVNPFPFPVTVKYRGIKITRHSSDTVITFPSGQTITVPGGGSHQVSIP